MRLIYNNCTFRVFWLFLSGFYLTQVTSFSPVYISFVFFFLFVCYETLEKEDRLISRLSIFFAYASIFYLLLFLNSPPPMVINVVISALSFFITYKLFRKRLIKRSYLYAVFIMYASLFIIDGMWRLANPELENIERLQELGIGFQIYKTNSLMYQDSNFVGLQAVFIMSCFLFFIGVNTKKDVVILSLLILSIILTYSRSAVIGCLISLFFYFIRNRKLLKISLFLLAPFLIAFLVSVGFSEFSDDLSFNSKIYILEQAYNYLWTLDLMDLLFGVGLGNSKEHIGIGSHMLLLTLFLELGLISLILFLIFISWLYIRLGYAFLYSVFPYIIISFSLGTTAIPYFFSFCACLLMERSGMLRITSI